MKALAKKGLLKGAKTCKLEFCEHCIFNKKTKVKSGTTIHRTKGVLDYVHTDVCGPLKNTSIKGKYYFVSFVDDHSRQNWVYIMLHKSEVLGIFVERRKRMEL